ncbi:hypothetical protein AXF42_Ash021779 [Apostasia shenzhenica]|uniref:Uncharacterized protein n=1 Tax=Apostasia shenzhenica TaxID=1088818 RepID=A0A2H9ZZF8_9ASPA|nr:hypothetical protein AXF42_Ash021779 [Apostasia shenzhenica]
MAEACGSLICGPGKRHSVRKAVRLGGADCDRRCSVTSCPILSGVSWDIRERGPARRYVYGQNAAQEPHVNISPPHCQGANINMGLGMRIVARVDALPKVCKNKMGAAPANSYPCTFTSKLPL